MPSPAVLQDLTDRSLRPLSDQEQTVGGVLLEDAWNLILSQRPSAADRITDAAFRALVVQVQCAAVLRVLRNPEGKLEEQIDDYRYRLDSATSTGALYLTDAELALLGAGDGQSDGAWSIYGSRQPAVGWWETPDRWVPST
jgi:hypothetical protein